MLFHERLLNDLKDPWPSDLILNEQHVDKVFHALTIVVRNWLLFVLDNLKDKA